MSFPALPRGAAYLKILNAKRRNALSFNVLQDLKKQLKEYNTSQEGELLMLPPRHLQPRPKLPSWVTDSKFWRSRRGHLPKVLVLRSDGPVFSSGHDLREMKEQGREHTEKTFTLCAEVMGMIKSCPIPIVCPIQGEHDSSDALLH